MLELKENCSCKNGIRTKTAEISPNEAKLIMEALEEKLNKICEKPITSARFFQIESLIEKIKKLC